MNIAVFGVGALLTVLVLIGALIAWVDGWRTALAVTALTIAFLAITGFIIAGWAWIATVLA